MSDPTAAAGDIETPTVEIQEEEAGSTVTLQGDWTLRGLRRVLKTLRPRLIAQGRRDDVTWNLGGVRRLDSTGALILWQAWQRAFPASVRIREDHRPLFDAWHERAAPTGRRPRRPIAERIVGLLASPARALHEHGRDVLVLIGQLLADIATLIRRPRQIPWREISATIHVTGTRAVAITGVLGFLFGAVLAYQAAVRLQGYGADAVVADLLGYSIVRELGPVLAAIILAGRSGSAITAQIGVMRLTQEIDAMKVMGIPVSQRLILPRVIGMAISMPLITMWLIAAAMAGSIVVTDLTIGLGYSHYAASLPITMPVVNLVIGITKGAAFGAAIGLAACHFGLRIEPNTRSLAHETTRSVVAGIALIIIINALFTIVLQDVGFKT